MYCQTFFSPELSSELSLSSQNSVKFPFCKEVSNLTERFNNDSSVTTDPNFITDFVGWFGTFVASKVTNFPPKPKLAPQGLFSHFGGCLSWTDCVFGVVDGATGIIFSIPGKESVKSVVG